VTIPPDVTHREFGEGRVTLHAHHAAKAIEDRGLKDHSALAGAEIDEHVVGPGLEPEGEREREPARRRVWLVGGVPVAERLGFDLDPGFDLQPAVKRDLHQPWKHPSCDPVGNWTAQMHTANYRTAASTPSNWSAEVLEDPAAVVAIAQGWQDLAESLGRPCVTPAWIMAFWRHVHVGRPLRIVVVRDEQGKLAGIAPFYVEREGALVSRYRLISDGVGARIEPLAQACDRPAVAAALARALCRVRPRPNVVTLDSSDEASGWGNLLRKEWPGRRGPRLLRHHPDEAPVVSVLASDEEWLAARSANLRMSLRRIRKRLGSGQVECRRSCTAEELAADLPTLFRLHDERCREAGRTSAMDRRTRLAIVDACLALHPVGGVELWLAHHGRETAGAQLFLRAGPRMLLLTGGLSSAWSRESVGLALIDRAIRHARDIGVATVDLGYGGVPYKWRFADHDEPVAREILFERDWIYPLACLSSDELRRAVARRAVEALPEAAQERIRHIRRAR
jgi:CelD/BcsL family acetyltransferase involved in cellulose biosynthesis